jgi:hypothetical protein
MYMPLQGVRGLGSFRKAPKGRGNEAQGGRVSEARSGTLGHRTRINSALQGRDKIEFIGI